MNGPTPDPEDKRLKALLGRIETPPPPADLAARIVTRVTAMPQVDAPRVDASTTRRASKGRPRRRARWPVWAASAGAMAAAASLALILLSEPARPSSPASAMTAAAKQPGDASGALPLMASAEPASPARTARPAPEASRHVMPASLPPSRAIEADELAALATPALTGRMIALPPAPPVTAESRGTRVGPPAPMQGPPAPAMPGGIDGTAIGYGFTGQEAAPAAFRATGP